MRSLWLLTLLALLTAAACRGGSQTPSVPSDASQPEEFAAPSSPTPEPVLEPTPVPPPQPSPPEEEPPAEMPTPAPPEQTPPEPPGSEGDPPPAPDLSREPAPEISGTTLRGETLALSDLLGKPVFVNVWASW